MTSREVEVEVERKRGRFRWRNSSTRLIQFFFSFFSLTEIRIEEEGFLSLLLSFPSSRLMSLLRQLPAARLLARAFPSAAVSSSSPAAAKSSSSSSSASSISASFARANASFAARAMTTKATAGGLPVEVRYNCQLGKWRR